MFVWCANCEQFKDVFELEHLREFVYVQCISCDFKFYIERDHVH